MLLKLFVVFSLVYVVSSRSDGKLSPGGTNVCSNTFTYQSYYYEEKVRIGFDNYRTCCKKIAFWCSSHCYKYRTKQVKYVVSKLRERRATAYFCCPGYARRGQSQDCPIAICNPPCMNGDCDKPNICKCKSGFTGKYCETEIDECLGSPCEQTCTNLRGDYACSCRRGFRKIINKTIGELHSPRCENVDECALSQKLISKDNDTSKALCKCAVPGGKCKATCVNTIGSYKCQCNLGFRLVAGRVCTDLDECQANTHKCDQICINRRSGYICACYAGYKLKSDNRTCTDVNECERGSNGGCDHMCTNTDGSFRCSCRKGYVLLGDNFRCQDIDECHIGRPCDRFNGICINRPGKYECSCRRGYELLYDRKTCVDINECARSNNCEQNCFNIDGSFACGCRSGYKLRSDGHTCEDIDECKLNIHGCDQICENIPGSYKCKCKPGFMIDVDGKSCLGQPCQTLYAPFHGQIQCEGRHLGDRCHFSCDIGFELKGAKTIQCLNGSRWENGKTECIAQQCDAATPPDYGILTLPCFKQYGSTCIVKCKNGYDLKGGNLINCKANKTETYWNAPAKCEEISLCKPNPCKHNGICQVLSKMTYHCDCTNTGFEGKHCTNGVIKVPELPQLLVGVQSDEFDIFAKPVNDLMFTLVTDPPNALEFSPSNVLYLFSPRTVASFQITPKQSGMIRISYQVTGADSAAFRRPPDSVVLVHNLVSKDKMTSIPGYNFMDKNCHEVTVDRCLDGRSIALKANCPWKLSGSKGYISIKDGQSNFPFSLAGVPFLDKEGPETYFKRTGILTVVRETQNMLLHGRRTCTQCAGVDFNQAVHDFLVKRNYFVHAYLKQVLMEVPWWVSMNLPFNYGGFHVNDVQSILVKDSRIKELNCINKPSSLKGTFTAMVLQAPVELHVLDATIKMESMYHTCILKSLCNREMYIAFPPDVSKILPIEGVRGLSIKATGLGVNTRGSLVSKCMNVTNAMKGSHEEHCVNGNVWSKGAVNVTTNTCDIKFTGETFLELKSLDKVPLERFTSRIKAFIDGKTTSEFSIPVYGKRLNLLFRDKNVEGFALIGGKNVQPCSLTCTSDGIHLQYKSNDLEVDYETSVLRIFPKPNTAISTHIRYNVFNGAVTGFKNANLIRSQIRNLYRGLPRHISRILSYARKYDVEKQAIDRQQKILIKELKEVESLFLKKESYQTIFVGLLNLQKQSVVLMNALTAFKDSVEKKETASTASRIKRTIDTATRVLRNLHSRIDLTANLVKSKEVDNGLSIRYTGKVCLHQLCFDNSDIDLHNFETKCPDCDGKDSSDNAGGDYIVGTATSRKLRQVGPSIRIAAGGVTKFFLSKDIQANGEGEMFITSDAIVSFLGQTYNVTMSINKTGIHFDLLNISIGGSQFDVSGSAPFSPVTNWNTVRFTYHGKPNINSTFIDELVQTSDKIILKNAIKTAGRIKDSMENVKKSKEKLRGYEGELVGLQKIFKEKQKIFLQAETDYATNDSKYRANKKSFRGYFTLELLEDISRNLSNVCQYKQCHDVCHTMRLFDMCQEPKMIQAEEMRCVQEQMIDRTTELQPFENMCDLTKYNFKSIYTGTCPRESSGAGPETLAIALGSALGGPAGAFVGWLSTMFSSCDTTMEVINLSTNYQVACVQKKSVTKVKVFSVSECIPYPTTVLSQFDTPFKCKVSNTSCIYITDGTCLSENNQCKKRQDIERRKLLETLGVYNDSWNQLNSFGIKLQGLLSLKQKADNARIEAKRQYERMKAMIETEKKNIDFAKEAIDNVLATNSLEKCFMDFHRDNNKSSHILSYSEVEFKTRYNSAENLLMEMYIDGDQRQGKQETSFLLSFDDKGVSFFHGVRKMVQYYLCKRHSRKRRSVTEKVSAIPLGRHNDLRWVDIADNVTDHGAFCLHAKNIFGFLKHLVSSLRTDIGDAIEERRNLLADVAKIGSTTKTLLSRATDETVKYQIDMLSEMKGRGLNEIHRLSLHNVLVEWKQKMEVFTKSNNFTGCIDLIDCINVALDNLEEFPSSVLQSEYQSKIQQLQKSFIQLLREDQTNTLNGHLRELTVVANLLSIIESWTLFCERLPKVQLLSPIQIDGFKGSKIILQCKVISKSKPIIIWSKDDEILPFETQEKLAVYIDNTTVGHYRCIARNKAGNSTSNSTHIVLRQKPTFQTQPADFSYLSVDQEIKPYFVCNVTADPRPKIAWYFQPFEQGTSIRLQTSKPVITINNPSQARAGFYYCFASNQFGSVHSRKARLDVLTSKLSQQDLSVSFDVSLGSIDNINKTSYKEGFEKVSRLQQHQKLKMDIEPSGERKVKFDVNFEDFDVSTNSVDNQGGMMLVNKVVEKRYSLSEGVTRVVSNVAESGDTVTRDKEVKNSVKFGFDGDQCERGSQLHRNGFACVPCTPGSFEWNRACINCPIGTYQGKFKATRCNDCPNNKMTSSVGSTMMSQCLLPILNAIDVVFVLDASSLTSSTDFKEIVSYISNFFKQQFHYVSTQFGLISFAETITVDVQLTTRKSGVTADIMRTKQKNENRVNVHKALEKAGDLLVQKGIDGHRKVIVTILKNPSASFKLTRRAALKLQSQNIQMISIDFGGLSESKILASRPENTNTLKFKDVKELSTSPLERISSAILKGECSLPGLDIAVVIESNIDIKDNVWNVAKDFVTSLSAKLFKKVNIHLGLATFDDTVTTLLNGTRDFENKVGLAVGNINKRTNKVDISNSLEFIFNRFVTEEFGFGNKRKIVLAFTKDEITDESQSEMDRWYKDERVLLLNVLMKYEKQDLGTADFGFEESMRTLFSLSELSEVYERIIRVLSTVNKSGCLVKNIVSR